MREAEFYENVENDKIHCMLCPHNCIISNGRRGLCGVRRNADGKLEAESYGKIASIALDPIEKKPLAHFHPGKSILSIGSYGCNFHCGFCQNYEISMGRPDCRMAAPQEVAEQSLKLAVQNNIGVAYTYNEPLIGFEFVKDCAILIKEQGQKNIVVTNGYIEEEPLKQLLPYIDAMNIDCKSFDSPFYKKIGGGLADVKRTVVLAAESCHVEVTILIIPGENDSEQEMEQLGEWLSGINKRIPLHISRFFPAYQYTHYKPTPTAVIFRLAEIARQYLDFVYCGNC